MDDFQLTVLLGALKTDRTNYPLDQLLVFINGIVGSDLPFAEKVKYTKQIKDALTSTPRPSGQSEIIIKIVKALGEYDYDLNITK